MSPPHFDTLTLAARQALSCGSAPVVALEMAVPVYEGKQIECCNGDVFVERAIVSEGYEPLGEPRVRLSIDGIVQRTLTATQAIQVAEALLVEAMKIADAEALPDPG